MAAVAPRNVATGMLASRNPTGSAYHHHRPDPGRDGQQPGAAAGLTRALA